MVWRLVLISWALAALSIALFYWLGPAEPPPEPAPAPVPVAAPPGPAEPPPPPPPRQPAAPRVGPLFVTVHGSHLARLDERGWTTFPEERPVFGLQRDPDGAPWVATRDASFLRLADTRLQPVASRMREDGGVALCEAFVPIAADQLWTVCGADVYRYHGGPWTADGSPHETGDTLALDVPVGLSLDAAGRLWLARRMRLEVRRELGGWFDVPVPDNDEPVALAPGPAGSMYVLTRRYLLRYGHDIRKPTQIVLATEGEFFHEKLAVSDRGNIVVLTHEALDTAYTQVMTGPGSQSSVREWVALTRTTDGASGRFSEGRDVGLGAPEAVAIDDRGRVWWTSRAGVAVLGDGPTRRWWRGAVPQLLHAKTPDTGLLSEVLVVDGGPEPLPAIDEAAQGSVRGRVVDRGKPRAGITVEMCRTPRQRYRRSPCQDQRLHFSAVSDRAGGFTITEVPPGEYEVVVQAGERWSHAHNFVEIAGNGKKPHVIDTIDLHKLPE